MSACKYCGFDVPRLSDEDCPANPANQHTGPKVRRELYDALHGVPIYWHIYWRHFARNWAVRW